MWNHEVINILLTSFFIYLFTNCCLQTGALVKTLIGHQRRIYALFPCLTSVWSGGEDAIINVWGAEVCQ